MMSEARTAERVQPCRIAGLSREQIPQVYPLVQSALPKLRLEEWVDYALALILDGEENAPSGILVAEQPRGCAIGLCAYRSHNHLVQGKVLSIEHFIVLSLVDELRIAAALAAEVETIAQRCGCAAVHTLLPAGGAESVLHALQDLGHRVATQLYSKAIASPAC
jgi:hypothetical protein